MTDKNKAKLLITLDDAVGDLETDGYPGYAKAIKQARSLLAARPQPKESAEDKPSVPREMVRQLVVCEMDSHPLRECWSWPKALKIVESFGFQVK